MRPPPGAATGPTHANLLSRAQARKGRGAGEGAARRRPPPQSTSMATELRLCTSPVPPWEGSSSVSSSGGDPRWCALVFGLLTGEDSRDLDSAGRRRSLSSSPELLAVDGSPSWTLTSTRACRRCGWRPAAAVSLAPPAPPTPHRAPNRAPPGDSVATAAPRIAKGVGWAEEEPAVAVSPSLASTRCRR
jgi:hypothetical protein